MTDTKFSFKSDLTISPHITWNQDNNEYGLSLNGGILFSAWYADIMSFTTGIQLSRQIIKSRQESESGNDNTTEISTIMYGIPTSLGCRVKSTERIDFFLGVGMYHYIFSTRDYDFNSGNSIEWLKYLDFSIYAGRQIADYIDLYSGLFYRAPVAPPSYITVLSKFGINLGVRYHFGKKYRIQSILN